MNIYIDAGAYDGATVQEFARTHDPLEWSIYAFEPNPAIPAPLFSFPVFWNRCAVWVLNGSIPYYTNDNKWGGQGNSVISGKSSGNLDFYHPQMVPCIHFSKWLINILNISRVPDKLIIKMDIEGAEYQVLEQMLSNYSISYVTELIVEWHYDRVGITKQYNDLLIKTISDKGVKIHDHS